MSGHRRNSIISYEKRVKLIKLVEIQGCSILRAGKRLGIKCSTAKQIVKRYKQTGQFFMKSKGMQKTAMESPTPLNHGANSQGYGTAYHPYYCYIPQQVPEHPVYYYLSPILCCYM